MKLAIGCAFAACLMPLAALAADQTPKKYDFSMIKPLPPVGSAGFDQGFFHDFELSVSGSYNSNWRVGATVPMERKSREATLGLRFRMGDAGFAAINGLVGGESIYTQPAAFAIDMDNSTTMLGLDAMVGYSPLPGVSFGVMGGVGKANATYIFAADPARTEHKSDGAGRRFGGFVNAILPTESISYSATLGVLRSFGDQDYDPGNMPASTSWNSTVGFLDLDLLYPVTESLAVKGGVSYVRVLDETQAAGSVARDDDWFALKAGLVYSLSQKLQVQATASSWLGNDTNRNIRFTTGLIYKF